MASSLGFLIRCVAIAAYTELKICGKNFVKKRVLVWSWAVHVGAGFISPPRRRGRRENLLAAERARRLSFASVILSAAGRSACKSSGGVEEPLRCLALPPPLQG